MQVFQTAWNQGEKKGENNLTFFVRCCMHKDLPERSTIKGTNCFLLLYSPLKKKKKLSNFRPVRQGGKTHCSLVALALAMHIPVQWNIPRQWCINRYVWEPTCWTAKLPVYFLEEQAIEPNGMHLGSMNEISAVRIRLSSMHAKVPSAWRGKNVHVMFAAMLNGYGSTVPVRAIPDGI